MITQRKENDRQARWFFPQDGVTCHGRDRLSHIDDAVNDSACLYVGTGGGEEVGVGGN